ncbi:contact-dependent growth inhibition system immunity protein [Serratia proteamaculans]
MTTTYPRIEKMMAGYINMDAYEITGAEDRAGQIRYYTTRVSPKAMKALLVELDEFEQAHRERLTDDFEEEFDFGAGITDAKDFFHLVRNEVNDALGEENFVGVDLSITAPFPFTDWPTVGELTVDMTWLTSGIGVRDGGNAKLRESVADSIRRSLHTEPYMVIKPRVLTREEIIKGNHLEPFGIIPPPIKNVLLERSLLISLQSMSVDRRITEDYVKLLEALLDLKGIDLKKKEPELTLRPLKRFKVKRLMLTHDVKPTR